MSQYKCEISLTTDDITSNFEACKKNKLDALYLTETTRTEWLQTLDEYLDEGDQTYSVSLYLWPQWLFQYYNELSIFEAIESVYLKWKS